MSDPIISVEGLGKAYRLGQRAEAYPTFRDAIMGAAKAPIRRFRQLSGSSRSEEEMFWALKDVSIEVQRGEVVGVIGRNGAGKSTLLKLLSRITQPTEGRAVLRGRVASLLEVGTGFHPELTGRENIYLNGSILGMRKAEIDRKFDEIVEFAEVEKFLDTPVKRYSSGMYVRLAFAVAAHLEPEILIVDEVLAVGDAEFQKKCLGKMQEVAQGQGRTVLFVSHNMVAVQKMCGSALYLGEGTLARHGDVASCIDCYLGQLTSNTVGGQIRYSVSPKQAALSILGVGLHNTSGQNVSVVCSGESFDIDIDLLSEGTSRSELDVVITGALGERVANISTRITQAYPAVSPGKWKWSCRVEDLWLSEGRYYISVESRDKCIACDSRPFCISFEVNGSAMPEALISPSSDLGLLVPPQSWRLTRNMQESSVNERENVIRG